MATTDRVLSFKGLVVLREFDHGAETCFWLVPMATDEFEQWWLRQETFRDNPPEAQEGMQLLAEIFKETWEPKRSGISSGPESLLMLKATKKAISGKLCQKQEITIFATSTTTRTLI